MIVVKTEVALAALMNGELDYSTFSTASIEATLKVCHARLLPSPISIRSRIGGAQGITSVADLRSKNYRSVLLEARLTARPYFC
jgi:hypothetical protein